MTRAINHAIPNKILSLFTILIAWTSTNAMAQDCKPNYKFSTIAPGILTIVGPDLPPTFTYKDNKMGGVEGPFFERFAKDNCLSVRVTILPPGSVIEAIKNGQADVAAGGWLANAERARVVGLSNSLFKVPSGYVGKNPSANLDDYAGKNIATVVGMPWNADLEKWGKGNIKVYDTIDATMADVRANRVAVSLMGVFQAVYRIRQTPQYGLSFVELKPEPGIPSFSLKPFSCVVHMKDNLALREALNEEIDELRKSGFLAQTLEENGMPRSSAAVD